MVVFDTEAGLLLVDGYHCVAAARRRGDETIEAEVQRDRGTTRSGTRRPLAPRSAA